jgi:hypothetical protein
MHVPPIPGSHVSLFLHWYAPFVNDASHMLYFHIALSIILSFYCLKIIFLFFRFHPVSYAFTMSAPPPQQQTMQELARQVAGNLDTFSGAYPFTAARAAKTKAFLDASTPPHMKRAILGDVSTTLQWLLVHGDQVVVVTRPVIATDVNGAPVFLASLGDSLTQVIPVLFPDYVLTSQVLALVTSADHATFRLPGCASVPGQLEPPPLGDGTPSTEQASIDRLHFDASGGLGDAPAFGVVPLLFPLALGEVPPVQSILEPFPVTGTYSPGLRMWFHAMQYLHVHNGGRSLHSVSILFDQAALPRTLFPTSTLTDSISVPVLTVDALSPQFGHVKSIHRETAQGALLAHAATLQVPVPTLGGTGGTTTPAFAAALSTAFAPLVSSLTKSTSSTTQVEREHLQEIKAVRARYQLCWGRIAQVTAPDGSVTEQVVLPDLSDGLIAVLTPSKASRAEEIYKESVTNHLRQSARSTSYYAGLTDWDVKSFGQPGICLRCGTSH